MNTLEKPGATEAAPNTGGRIDVPQVATPEQVRFFVENGYLVLPDLVTPDEVEELRRDTAYIARGGYPCESLQPLPAGLSDDEILQTILCIHQPHYISPVMDKYARHP